MRSTMAELMRESVRKTKLARGEGFSNFHAWWLDQNESTAKLKVQLAERVLDQWFGVDYIAQTLANHDQPKGTIFRTVCDEGRRLDDYRNRRNTSRPTPSNVADRAEYLFRSSNIWSAHAGTSEEMHRREQIQLHDCSNEVSR